MISSEFFKKGKAKKYNWKIDRWIDEKVQKYIFFTKEPLLLLFYSRPSKRFLFIPGVSLRNS